jgi:cobalt-precorrin-5B (C1)-methyltransferase
MARTGYTLPVFAVAAAKAALLHLQQQPSDRVDLDLLPGTASIAIEQVARLSSTTALAITRSDPGDNLDLTRNTPIWAQVSLLARGSEPLIIEGGEGLGRDGSGRAAIYKYAHQLFGANLTPLVPPETTLAITIILPAGQRLATRTSNAAFGILDGLSLLGTRGISQPLSTEEHLDQLRADLRGVATNHDRLIFCIGSNGRQVADRAGLPETQIVQTGNWIGAMLLEAAHQGVVEVLLLGYQGKLIKLAGGIFNTSSHLADAKLEILGAATLQVGGGGDLAQQVLGCPTADAAYQLLLARKWSSPVFDWLADHIAAKACAYIYKYTERSLTLKVVLFDRQGQVISGEQHLRASLPRA